MVLRWNPKSERSLSSTGIRRAMFDFSIEDNSMMAWMHKRLSYANLGVIVPQPVQRFILRHRLGFIRLWQTFVIVVSVAAAFCLRFDLTIPDAERAHLLLGAVLALLVKTSVFYVFGIERGWWR